MRFAIIVAFLAILYPFAAVAQSASQSVPTPRVEAEVNGYRVAAIAVGAVAGVVVANAVTGGMITPIMLAGAPGAGMMAQPGAATYGIMAVQAGIVATGAVVGGYIGNWLYGR